MEPRQFQFFQILQFPKEHWVDGLSIYTWGKIAEVYPEWKSFQLGSKEGIRCLFPSSLLTLWIWRPSSVSSSLRDKNTRKGAKGVLDMFLDLEKRQKNMPKNSHSSHFYQALQRCYSLSVSKGKEEPDWQKSKTDNGANRARLGICAADRDEFKQGRERLFQEGSKPRIPLLCLCLPPCRVWSQLLS